MYQEDTGISVKARHRITLAKDVWLVGIGLGLVLDDLTGR